MTQQHYTLNGQTFYLVPPQGGQWIMDGNQRRVFSGPVVVDANGYLTDTEGNFLFSEEKNGYVTAAEVELNAVADSEENRVAENEEAPAEQEPLTQTSPEQEQSVQQEAPSEEDLAESEISNEEETPDTQEVSEEVATVEMPTEVPAEPAEPVEATEQIAEETTSVDGSEMPVGGTTDAPTMVQTAIVPPVTAPPVPQASVAPPVATTPPTAPAFAAPAYVPQPTQMIAQPPVQVQTQTGSADTLDKAEKKSGVALPLSILIIVLAAAAGVGAGWLLFHFLG